MLDGTHCLHPMDRGRAGCWCGILRVWLGMMDLLQRIAAWRSRSLEISRLASVVLSSPLSKNGGGRNVVRKRYKWDERPTPEEASGCCNVEQEGALEISTYGFHDSA